MKKKKALILGAGFAGCTVAYLLSQEGFDCVIIEKENYIGGGCRTFFYGGHPYTYGPRPYYGYSQKIFNWLDSFTEMRRFHLSLLSYVEQENRFFSYPIHEDEIPKMKLSSQIYSELKNRKDSNNLKNFEEYWINRIGPTLYDMFINIYSKKMWGLNSNCEIDTFNWSAKNNPIERGSKNCYKDAIHGYPISKNGYNDYFEKTTKDAEVILKSEVIYVDLEKKQITLSTGKSLRGDIIVSSICIDQLCNYSLGKLPYAGREFIKVVLPCRQIFPEDIRFCHYTQNEPYTRIVEYKKITYYDAEDTLLIFEFPSNKNKLYPYMIKKYLLLAEQYLKLLPKGVYSIGRSGTYKYSTIEQTIVQSFDVMKKITGKSIENMEDEFYKIGDISLMKNRK